MASIIPIHAPNAARTAADHIKSGKIIAVPTDTVYGLACDANNPDAIKRLYEIKARNTLKPVAICVNSISDVKKWGDARIPDGLLNALLPGAVTLVFEKSTHLNNPFLNPETTKIGIRIPNYQFIKEITCYLTSPMALTSANVSNSQSTLSIKEFAILFPKLSAVFDGGTLHEDLVQNRSGSTVVDLSTFGHYNIIREGVAYLQTIQVLERYGLIKVL